MKIGFIGLGKLGLPMALAIESRGHQLLGTDASEHVRRIVEQRQLPYLEEGAQAALSKTRLEFCSLVRVVEESELIFLAVQTPHQPEFEGVTPMPSTRSDFDYRYLAQAVRDVCMELQRLRQPRTLVVISTVLPGTLRREVFSLITRLEVQEFCRLCYNPSFIAMGTAMQDFLDPEFVLLGASADDVAEEVKSFYSTIHNKPVFRTSTENAELIKVLYNTFIGFKIVFANAAMEICHKTPGTNVDDVTTGLALATRRLLSPAYLRGGMGDGGGCHPRDNIALSWLAQELCLSRDIFSDLMQARDAQTKWLANQIIIWHRKTGLPIVLLGAAYKPQTNITTGSPARLLQHFLVDRGYKFITVDPFVGSPCYTKAPSNPAVFFASTRHMTWLDVDFPPGSVVIDPWRYLKVKPDSTYVPLGIGRE